MSTPEEQLEKEFKQKRSKEIIKRAKYKYQSLSKPFKLLSFVLVFALVGFGLLIFANAENPSGEIPTGANDFVVRYDPVMSHAFPDDDFAEGSFSSLLLYGNGLMLCGDHSEAMSDPESSALQHIKNRQLNRREVEAIYKKIKELGFDRVYDRTVDQNLTPSLYGTTETVTLNTTKETKMISLYQLEQNADFQAITTFLQAECKKATKNYEPDEIIVESLKLETDAGADLEVIPEEIPSDGFTNEPKSKSFKGKDAKKIKEKIPKSSANYKTSDNKVIKVRVLPKVPEYQAAVKVASGNSWWEPERASAATDRSLRFLFVISADGVVPSNAQTLLNDLSSTLPQYYAGQTGKSPTVAEVGIVRGSKTAAQYMVCPPGTSCDLKYPQSSASAYNLHNEFKKDGFNTIMMYSWTADGKCSGFGGPTTADSSVTFWKYGVASFSGVKCSKSGIGRVHRVGAHEAGHGFGLNHTCDTTLMDGCGYSGVDDYRPLRADQAAALRNYSPYFNYTPPPCPSGTTGTYPNCVTNTVPPPATMFFPIYPARIMETRSGSSTVDGQFNNMGLRSAGSTTALTVYNRAGVPSGATAVSVNVTVVNSQAPGFITVYPCGSALPNASSLNYSPGVVTANSVISRVGTNGQICIYTLAATDVVVDISGAFPSGSPYLSFNPARILETRPGNSTSDGQFNGIGIRGAGSSTAVTVVGRAGVPSGATAVTLKVTSANAQAPGFLTVYPCGSPVPNSSHVNYVTGVVASNTVIAKVGTNGQVCIYTLSASDVIVDISGAFPAGSPYVSFNPARLMETRGGFSTVDGQFNAIGARTYGSTTALTVAGRGGVPSNATTAVLNVTVVNPQSPGFITVFPCGSPQPSTSNVNYSTNSLSFNSVIAKVGTSGQVCFFTSASTDLIVDVNGAFTN